MQHERCARGLCIAKMDVRIERCWSGCRDSNPGPPAPQAGALPGCATSRWRLLLPTAFAAAPAAPAASSRWLSRDSICSSDCSPSRTFLTRSLTRSPRISSTIDAVAPFGRSVVFFEPPPRAGEREAFFEHQLFDLQRQLDVRSPIHSRAAAAAGLPQSSETPPPTTAARTAALARRRRRQQP